MSGQTMRPALVEAKSEMRPDEQLCAFLDDIYALSSPDRTHDLCELLGVKLASAGIRLHTGKMRCWNRSGVPPPNMADLGPDVWSPQGVKILGTPVGSEQFIEEAVQREERILWDVIRQCQTCSALGKSFCSVQGQGVTTGQERFHPVVQHAVGHDVR